MISSHLMLRRRDLWPASLALSRFTFAASQRAAVVLVRVADRKLVQAQEPNILTKFLAPPGSALKPITLGALLEAGKLRPSDEFLCPGRLVLAGRNMSCSHPPISQPMDIARAIAYSCNCAVAHFAQRLQPGELPACFRRLGFSSVTGLIDAPEAVGAFRSDLSGEELQLQALGQDFVRITPLELAVAYVRLARECQKPELSPIREGLESAVAFGTAQQASLRGVQVAGKTGSVRDASGVHLAWFAGFAPTGSPEVAITVLAQGYSGGGDAAPIAHEALNAWFAGRS
jgi:cell division protein FtsI/penicillin-binding protein 2